MNKEELISALSEKTGFKKTDVRSLLDAFLETLPEALQNGGTLQLTGHFSISTINRKASEGRNPQTGQKITIPARTQVKFSAGKMLKESVNTASKGAKKKKAA
jgi:DNA-binding protein HU-beta